MTPPRWITASVAVLSLVVTAAPALADICILDPINPLCCPSPCPVYDPIRVAKLLADVDNLGQAVAVSAQIAQTATQVGQTIGDARAAATTMSNQLSGFAGTLSSEVTAIQSSLSTNPVQALSSLKQTLFEPAGTPSTSTQMAGRRSARLAALQDEQMAAFATSLMRSQALPNLAPQQNLLVGTMTTTQQLQSDMAANSASRLALYQDTAAIHQLVSAWVAQRSMQAGLAHPRGAGGPAGTP